MTMLCLYCVGWWVGNLSTKEISDKLYEMSPQEVVSGLKELGLAKGWIRKPDLIPIPSPAETRDLRWEQDLDYLNASIGRLHAVAWVYITPEDFAKEIDQLKLRVSQLSDHGIACEVSRILALLGDGHTGCGASQTAFPFRVLPIKVRLFSDGLFIVSATKDHADTIGCKITHADSVPIAEVADKTRKWFSAENRMGDLVNVESSLTHVDFLFAAGVASSPDRVTLRLESPQGESIERELVGQPETTKQDWIPNNNLPTFLTQFEKDFWFQPMKDDQLLYVKYNRCRDHAGFALMSKEIEQVLDSIDIRAVTVDLRRNGGGDSSVIDPLLRLLEDRGFHRRGKLFVLTDRYTFSSGFHNLLTLKKMHAIHVGEASSQKLNYGGNIRNFELPNTKLIVAYPTQNSARLPGIDIRLIEPDQSIALSHDDYVAKRDPVLDFVKAAVR
jgi:hypothetical protein